MSKHILVLGATGNIGSKLANNLLAAGHQVTAVARTAQSLEALKAKGAHIEAADIMAPGKLEQLLAGKDGAFVLIPPSLTDSDVPARARAISDRIAEALAAQPVAEVVALSSHGADKPHLRVGPIRGVSYLEEQLNGLNLKALHILRPTYFMENLMANVHSLQAEGKAYGAVPGDMPNPMIATQDIAAAAAVAFTAGIKPGMEVQLLLGPRDYTVNEAVALMGKALGKTEAVYVQVPIEAAQNVMVQHGISESMAGLYGEMFAGMAEDKVFNLDPRTPENTTTTTLETFLGQALGAH